MCYLFFTRNKKPSPLPFFFSFCVLPPLFFQALKEMSLPKRFLLLFSFRGIF